MGANHFRPDKSVDSSTISSKTNTQKNGNTEGELGVSVVMTFY
jgi:hypothetical protein